MAEEMVTLETRSISSLAKVFADEELKASPYKKGSALANESYSYQMAYRADRLTKGIRVKVISPLEASIELSQVGLVPVELAAYANHDEHVIRGTAGLYPDPLYSLSEEEGLALLPNQWRSIWVTVNLQGNSQPGLYPIRVIFETASGDQLAEETFELEVVGESLPPQQLIYTNWFHSDCLATYYNVEVFSEEHWTLIETFLRTAVQHGMNMVLTPLFTPPLDTAVGGERPTVQLVGVKRNGTAYEFDFTKLERWVQMCSGLGIQYFEFSHLFTQWGVKHAPKIIAQTEQGEQQIFGWSTDAGGEEYGNFLNQFLPELVAFIRSRDLEQRSFFHVSDEPHKEHLPNYKQASDRLKAHLEGFPIIDALSDYDFYEQGYVQTPIPASNHIEPFIENQVPDLWTYYCCSQYEEVSNRFIDMPSWRNRILGFQLYKFQIRGFLHWGYNFWYSQYSIRPINPYQQTDANYAFPSGDPFVVYPGSNGEAVLSLRLKVFYDAFQDLRALEKLESYIGRDQVLLWLEEGLDEEITFKQYPRSDEWLLTKREELNHKLKSLAASS
ncbi:DUF4091 domain-containing protein [Paenibacillus senegalensis]|uniref:DUF4091 domain-containing protein n=1 Tax=Paenibacillus senegalensis TaxID=1465766 RepID=UPI0002894B6E|nr:DUF4091 domain-containing protein [Paenibacillus senegalensis]